jgi:uncharacterized Zn-binding protein involved in type VI secretion
MTRFCGFLAETTEGTSLYNAASSTITPFGYMTRGFPIPWPTRKETLTFQAGTRGAQEVTLGKKALQATYDFDYGHAYPFALALGDVSYVVGTGVNTITFSDPDDLPAFSIYSESNGKAYTTRGCKVEQLSLKIAEGIPMACEMDIMGWDTAAATVIDGGTADQVWPSSAVTGVRGPSEIEAAGGVFTYNSQSQPNISEMMINISNSLDAATGIMSPVTTGIDVLDVGGVMTAFKGEFRGTAGDLFEAFVAGTSADFVVKFIVGTDKYHQITLTDLTLGQPRVISESENVTTYALSAWAVGDCIEVEVVDGHDYSSLI